MSEQPRIPRFRIVLEASFPDADPMDPSGYLDMLARWKESLQRSPILPCTEVQIREVMTIGAVDDYDDWRWHRGEYDMSTWPRKGMSVVSGRKKPDSES